MSVEMKKIIIGILVFSYIFISMTAFAETSEGMIVFTKSKLTRDGFREFILKEIFGERNWWTFFRRDICVINPDGT